jgi:soluble lytic murein transglycosylase-like protein
MMRLMYSIADLREIAEKKAAEHGLDPAVVCAVIEQESGWNPWLERYEPLFFERYLENPAMYNEVRGWLKSASFHASFATEIRNRAYSRGLMQTMGATARVQGFAGPLGELHEPETGIEVGCRVLKGCLGRAKGDIAKALLGYNGGGNKKYPDEVLARMENYRNGAKA